MLLYLSGLVVFVFPCLNVAFLTWALFERREKEQLLSPQAARGATSRSRFGLGLAFASQILYFGVVAASYVRRFRYPPRVSVLIYALLAGLALCLTAFVLAASFGRGAARWVGIFVALATAAQWFVVAIGLAAG